MIVKAYRPVTSEGVGRSVSRAAGAPYAGIRRGLTEPQGRSHALETFSTFSARRLDISPVNPYSYAMTNDNTALIARIEDLAVGEDFCHICGRCTDHGGEHTDDQLLAWAQRPGLLQSLLHPSNR